MKVCCIVQARMGSSRLPGKVLLKVCNRPLIELMFERVKLSKKLNSIWLATSKNPENDPLAHTVEGLGVPVYRGSEDDVLSRYYEIALKEKADVIVRLTGDCPLIDPNMIDQMVNFYLENYPKYGYVTNSVEPTYPDGLDIEVFSFDALKKAHESGKMLEEREHVTAYFHPVNYKKSNVSIFHFKNQDDFSHLRWTVDNSDDFELVKRIFEHFLPMKKFFGWKDILQFVLSNSELVNLNTKHKRNENFNYNPGD